ncbi:hypothetical protein GLE_0008 [Lysobacter enzymogenes]|uniref:Uncharacterized protein n=1 Tax=Lysobacter enzymogenes TaxID=69 RepID=A0A0S2D9Y9_LYSEN|nr:hypothetical protein [Lysobacter enzymogenes]ALN55367.1 hypothetical protein GLE_0008 [Lysobacter enzymogenes]
MQADLDNAGIYKQDEIDSYAAVRFKSMAAYAAGEQAQHKEIYAATSAPTERFNDQVNQQRAAIQSAEAAFEVAKSQGNEAGMKQANATRTAHAEVLQQLLDFKSGLTRFGSLYTYIAQTIDLGDPDLEAFASFARLLAKRLHGVPPEQVDVSALVLTGFDVKPEDMPGGEEPAKEEAVILKPVGPGGGGQPELPVYLRQVIARLNSIFGEATPLTDKVALVNHLFDIVREDANTVAQIKNNPRDVAMNGNIKGSVQSALVRALGSHTDLVTQVLKNDKQALNSLVDLLYEMVKDGQNIDRAELEA